MDVGGDIPAERLVEQIVFGGGRQVFGPPDHVGDDIAEQEFFTMEELVKAFEISGISKSPSAFDMDKLVDDVGEVIGGQAVGLDENLVVQIGVIHGDLAVHRVLEGGGPLRDALADDIGLPGVQLGLNLLGGEGEAVPVIFGVGVAAAELLQPLPGAEAAVGMALFNQKLGVDLEVIAMSIDKSWFDQMEQRIPHGEVRTRFAPSPTYWMV